MSDGGFKWVPLAGGMLDQIECDCGWQSATFFDGDVYAYNQWKRHVKAGHAADTPPHSFAHEQCAHVCCNNT